MAGSEGCRWLLKVSDCNSLSKTATAHCWRPQAGQQPRCLGCHGVIAAREDSKHAAGCWRGHQRLCARKARVAEPLQRLQDRCQLACCLQTPESLSSSHRALPPC